MRQHFMQNKQHSR